MPDPLPPTAGDLRRSTLAVAVWTIVVVVIGDVALLHDDIVKIEQANAIQLATHALIRDGQIVVSSDVAYYAESLHHLFFYPILLFTPRLEHVATVLNAVYWASSALLGVLVGRRLGTTAGLLSAAALLAAPVTPILSKHVIPTALVPAVGALFLDAHLAFAAHGRRADLGRLLLTLVTLIAFNNGHIWLAVPVLWAVWQTGTRRPPAWALVGAALLLVPVVARRVWMITSGQGFELLPSVGSAAAYPNLGVWYRRFVLVEPYMDRVFPNLWLLLLLPPVAAALTWRLRGRVPPGLVPLLLTAPLLAFAHLEASVVWMLFLWVWLGWLASQAGWMRALVSAHLVISPAAFYGLVASVGPPPDDFFALSLLRERYHMLDVLRDEVGMGADEFETLGLRHPQGEEGLANALTPGAGYLIDRVLPPLPPGGDRCLLVSDPDDPGLPGTPTLDLRDGVLRYRAWTRPPEGCNDSPRLPSAAVLVYDLRAGELREINP